MKTEYFLHCPFDLSLCCVQHDPSQISSANVWDLLSVKLWCCQREAQTCHFSINVACECRSDSEN